MQLDTFRNYVMGKILQAALMSLFFIGALFNTGCATNPVSGKQDLVLMSEEDEIKLGKQAHQEIMKQYRPYENPALQRYVEGIVEELSKKSHRSNLVFHVTILDSPDINAFALPGGYVYVTRGIMAYMNSEAELAGVLGHEIGHVTARHGVRQHSVGTLTGIGTAVATILTGSSAVGEAANYGGTALARGYGREHELEADRLGAEYLAQVGYDPEEMINVVGILKAQEDFDRQLAKEEGREPRAYHGTFSTHPSNDKRLQEVVGAANKFASASTREANREEYLNYIDGMIVGPSAKDGVLRDNKFYHKDLNIYIEFPLGWKVHNLADRLLAISSGKDVQLQITLTDMSKRQTPQEYLNEQFKDSSLKNGENVTTPDFQGYTGLTTIKASNGKLPSRVAAVFDDKRIYQILAVGRHEDALDRYDSSTLHTIKSLRKLKKDEAALAKSKNIRLIRTKSGDTFESLSKRSVLSHHPVEQLRLYNGLYPDGEPKPGQLVKIIE